MKLLRLPIIRHIRAAIEWRRMDRWYANWQAMGFIAWNRDRDEEVIRQIWRGER